ncbi:MAG: hypothetical protein F6K31_11015 [Symploca sp. SIO2G7]|nr:hypothetical protein [Symploca sp. SIO2G7]
MTLAMNPFDNSDSVIIDGKRYTKKQLKTFKPNPTLPIDLKLVIDAAHLDYAFHQLNLGKNMILDQRSLNFYQNYRCNLCPIEITNSLSSKSAIQFYHNLTSWKKLVKEFGGGRDQGLFSPLLPKVTFHQLQKSKSSQIIVSQSVVPLLAPLRNFLLNHRIISAIFVPNYKQPMQLSIIQKEQCRQQFLLANRVVLVTSLLILLATSQSLKTILRSKVPGINLIETQELVLSPELKNILNHLGRWSWHETYLTRLQEVNPKLYQQLSTDPNFDYPSIEQLNYLVEQEAKIATGRKVPVVLLGNSMFFSFPRELLPPGSLNQSFPGENIPHTINRLSLLKNLQPDSFLIMVGNLDLMQGKKADSIIAELSELIKELQDTHPQSKIVIFSVLPRTTAKHIKVPPKNRSALLKFDKVKVMLLNQKIQQLTQEADVIFIDAVPYVADANGNLRAELSLDGLHLLPQGYAILKALIDNE